jgi:hypothetical protein
MWRSRSFSWFSCLNRHLYDFAVYYSGSVHTFWWFPQRFRWFNASNVWSTITSCFTSSCSFSFANFLYFDKVLRTVLPSGRFLVKPHSIFLSDHGCCLHHNFLCSIPCSASVFRLVVAPYVNHSLWFLQIFDLLCFSSFGVGSDRSFPNALRNPQLGICYQVSFDVLASFGFLFFYRCPNFFPSCFCSLLFFSYLFQLTILCTSSVGFAPFLSILLLSLFFDE